MATLEQEQHLWQQGLQTVAGVDEVGRGPLAGPVVAAAVVLPPDCSRLKGLTDSKKLKPAERQRLCGLIQEVALDYALGVVSAPVIDRINILQASFLAMRRALLGLQQRPEHVLVDGNKLIPHWEGAQSCLIKGDSRSLSIAAASVLAKVTRDSLMNALSVHYPGYGLERHMGYPTAMHRQQIGLLGLSPQHRRSFCKKFILQPRETAQ